MWVTALLRYGSQCLPLTLGLESQILLMAHMTLCDFTPGSFHHLIPSYSSPSPSLSSSCLEHIDSASFRISYSPSPPSTQSFLQGSAHLSAPLCSSLCSDVSSADRPSLTTLSEIPQSTSILIPPATLMCSCLLYLFL